MYRIEYVLYRQGLYRIRIVSAADRIVPALETGQIAMDAKSPSDVKTLRGYIYGLHIPSEFKIQHLTLH